MPARLHLRGRVGDWTPGHVAESFEDFALKDSRNLRRLRRVCGYIAAYKRAVLRDSMEGYNTLYLSLMLGSNTLYQEGPRGRFIETLDMLSASSINMFRPKEDLLVVVALSLPLTKALLISIEARTARERFMKHCAHVRRSGIVTICYSGQAFVCLTGEAGSQLVGGTAAPSQPSRTSHFGGGRQKCSSET